MLTADERAVLWKLDEGWAESWAYGFRSFDMPRERARSACRSLAAKGLAQYWRGLFTEDGEVAGSGYAITRAGHDLAPAIGALFWSPWCECRQWPREPLWRDPRDVLAA